MALTHSEALRWFTHFCKLVDQWHKPPDVVQYFKSYKGFQAIARECEQKLTGHSDLLVQFTDKRAKFRDRFLSELLGWQDGAPSLEYKIDYQSFSRRDWELSIQYSNLNQAVKDRFLDKLRNLPKCTPEHLFEKEIPKVWRELLVSGCQPRAAELVFPRTYEDTILHRHGLRDLNLIFDSPPNDWSDGKTDFDVKCNLYYKTYSHGLRGFRINIPTRCKAEDAAYIFFSSYTYGASCTFIGYADESNLPREHKLLPFYFNLPIHLSCNFESVSTFREEIFNIISDLKIDSLPLARRWQHAQSSFELWDRLKSGTIDNLEFYLFQLITERTLEHFSKQAPAIAQEFLGEMTVDLASPGFLFRLAGIEGRSLHSIWIDEVLLELCRHWEKIRCPQCSRATFTISDFTITGNGTIQANLRCQACDFQKSKATVVTHCHVCGHYPLILGKNELCNCGGLRCSEVRLDSNGHEYTCNACKRNCPNSP